MDIRSNYIDYITDHPYNIDVTPFRTFYYDANQPYAYPYVSKKNSKSGSRERHLSIVIYFKDGYEASNTLYEYVMKYHKTLSLFINLTLKPVYESNVKTVNSDKFPLMIIKIDKPVGTLIGTKSITNVLEFFIKNYNVMFNDYNIKRLIDKHQLPLEADLIDEDPLEVKLRRLQLEKDQIAMKMRDMELKMEQLDFINTVLIEDQSEPSIAQEMRCVICLNDLKTHVFKPCNHFACCANCANYIAHDTKKCPLCKQQVENIERIFVT